MCQLAYCVRFKSMSRPGHVPGTTRLRSIPVAISSLGLVKQWQASHGHLVILRRSRKLGEPARRGMEGERERVRARISLDLR